MALRYNWNIIGRPEQQAPPGNWFGWLVLAGRGTGKTRTAAEWVRWKVETGQARQIALIGETKADVRDVMIEQFSSSLLKISRPDFMPHYEPSKRRVTWPNGAVATAYSGDEPDQLRGPQHDLAWPDEPAKWKYAEEAWSNLMFGLRLLGPDGSQPQFCATTTPRPIPLIIRLARGERQLDGSYIPRKDIVVTTGSTYDNAANLAPAFLEMLLREYEGTRLGRQELHAEILDEIEGALWTLARIEELRVRQAPANMHRIVVAVDPPGTEDGSECGIVAAGVARGDFGSGDATREHCFVLRDESDRGKPEAWARRAVNLLEAVEGDCIVCEVNNGGDMVESTIRSVAPRAPVKQVRASRGKQVRAEPVSALYQQGFVHHVGAFPKLEDQQTTWVPGQKSPDRMDALVWAVTELMLDDKPAPRRTSAASPILIDMKG